MSVRTSTPSGRRSSLVGSLWAAGCVFAEEEAEVLLSAAGSPEELERLLAARVGGAPLEQVVGWTDFAGSRILLEPGVFVPRRRTGLLVDVAADLAPAGGVLADLCCGSGAVAAAVLARRPDLTAYAGDADPVAVRCARRNLPRAVVSCGDLFGALREELRGRVDVLVVNAPYVPSAAVTHLPREARLHEPRAALDGGADGCDLHRRVAAEAPDWLAPCGALVVETSRPQLGLTSRLVREAGLSVTTLADEGRDATAVVGRSRPRPTGPR